MKQGFATKVGNVRRFLAGVGTVEQRGAPEAGWLLARGEPGLGKTGTLQWYASNPRVNAVYIRVLSVWSRSALMYEIVRALGGDPQGGLHALTGQAAGLLLERPRTLVIDETEHTLIGRDMRLLEAVRDVSDLAKIPVIIGGRAHIEDRFTRHKQFASRIVDVARFEAITLKDVGALVDELSEFEWEPGAVEIAANQARGSLRLARNAIATAERLARQAGDAKRVKAAHIAEQTLCTPFDPVAIGKGSAR